MHIKNLVADTEKTKAPSFSFEYFPPKTAQGVQNLYDRMDRDEQLWPQAVYGLETCMHLTCTDMGLEKVNDALQKAYKAGCTNILALRGDPPRDQTTWTAADGNFRYARDLVKHIRDTYGDHFDIGVAGYPEGCDDNKDEDSLLDHLKEKVDMGAGFIVTQMFYDADNFLRWVGRVRERGITVPILPGIMPIATYASFLRRAKHMQCRVPPEWMTLLEPVKNDDVAVREIGKTLVAELCRKLLAGGIHHLHFYTMNLAQAVRMVLDELDWTPSAERPLKQALPWKQSKGFGRREEDVRPIFWRNRNKSYVIRTQDWDEFPNGRWGDSRSPAFGELDAYGIGLTGTNEANRKKWGEPTCVQDIADTFVRYLEKKIETLPWSESALAAEADPIKDDLVALNKRGILTINSQPAAYLELLIPPYLLDEMISRLDDFPNLTYYAVTKNGELKSNAPSDGPNAVTWGVFPRQGDCAAHHCGINQLPGLERRGFRLGVDWAHCFDANTPSRALIEGIMNEWYLVNIGEFSNRFLSYS
nr:methylenetetrahydrofolate reductase (NAD(P)H) met13 [Trichoderma atroviride]